MKLIFSVIHCAPLCHSFLQYEKDLKNLVNYQPKYDHIKMIQSKVSTPYLNVVLLYWNQRFIFYAIQLHIVMQVQRGQLKQHGGPQVFQ